MGESSGRKNEKKQPGRGRRRSGAKDGSPPPHEARDGCSPDGSCVRCLHPPHLFTDNSLPAAPVQRVVRNQQLCSCWWPHEQFTAGVVAAWHPTPAPAALRRAPAGSQQAQELQYYRFTEGNRSDQSKSANRAYPDAMKHGGQFTQSQPPRAKGPWLGSLRPPPSEAPAGR